MPSALQTNLIAVALKLIDREGRIVTYRRVVPGVFTPATSTVAAAANTDTDVKTVQSSFSLKEIDGTTVEFGDKLLLIAAADLPARPSKSDLVIDGSETGKVMGLIVISPGDTDILYKVLVRP